MGRGRKKITNIESAGKYVAIPPGETIRGEMKYWKMNLKTFADKMGISEVEARELISGVGDLTEKRSRQLEVIFDIPYHFWLRLENDYRLDLLKVRSEKKRLMIVNGGK